MDQRFFILLTSNGRIPVLDLFMAAISDVDIWKPLLIGVALDRGRLWRIQGAGVPDLCPVHSSHFRSVTRAS